MEGRASELELTELVTDPHQHLGCRHHTNSTHLHPSLSRQSMTSNPHTPVGGPRLVTKLCVVGEAGEEDGSGASFLLFMRANLPHQTQDQSYPLFPGEPRSTVSDQSPPFCD